MKKTSLIVALLMMATASFATIQIYWSNTSFLSGLDEGSGDFEKSTFATADGFKIIWDLLYTDGAAVNASWDKETGELSYDGVTLLSRRLWNAPGDAITVTDEYPASTPSEQLKMDLDIAGIAEGSTVYKSDFTGTGGIYAAVFQYIGDEKGGAIFCAMTEVNNEINWNNTKDAPSPVHFTDDMTSLSLLGYYGVPEPATMSLLGLGALAMVLRRKLRK